MLAVESVLVPLISLIVLAVFVSVFLVLYCIDCGKQSKYETLDRNYVESRDSDVQQKKQLEKQRQEAWSDAQYYARSLQKSKLMTEYDLWEMGYRKTRRNFLIKFDNRVSLLSLVEPGQGCVFPFTTEPSRAMFREIITALQHPFIQPMSKTDFWIEQSKSVSITHFSDEGSIRDYIHNSKPTFKWDQKYENTKVLRGFDKKKISEYGRHILEALIFIKECGVPYTHLHSGNVIIKSDVARITNIENGLLNLERQQERLYRQFLKKSGNKFGKMDLETISFGALIYEMATGYPLKNLSQLDHVTLSTKEILEILDSIFNDTDKHPTLEDLIKLPLFSNVKLKNFIKPEPAKFDEKIKNTLTAARYEAKQLHGILQTSSRSKTTSPKTPKRVIKTNSPATPITSSTSPSTTSRSPSGPLNPARTQTVVTTTVTTTRPAPAPAPGPPPPPPPSSGPPPPPPSVTLQPPQQGRNDLLSSIRGFGGGLKKTKTNDKSGPKLNL